MEKTYYLIHIYFGKKSEGEENHFTVYSYQKSRRFTARQACIISCMSKIKICLPQVNFR